MDNKKVNKRPNGRKKLDEAKKRERFYIYLNKKEREALNERVKDSIHSTKSAFIRDLILGETNKARHINPVRFLNEISQLAMEISKIGTNINQLARHANQMAIHKIIHPDLAKAIDEKLDIYSVQQKTLINKLKEILMSR